MGDIRPAQRARVAVIGKGLIGSAAARHLARQIDGVVLIGPDEPAVRADHRDVFGSHYDEGRIYRILDGDPIWGRLAERAIARYAAIAAQSGIQFHEQVGMLVADLRTPAVLAAAYARTGEALDASFERLTAVELAARFPYLRFDAGAVGLFELPTGGYLSPRRMVVAQTVAAARHGATVVREPVHTLTLEAGGVAITTATGRVVRAERAVVATGGFANVHAVLPHPLDIVVRGRTIVLAEVAGALLERLRPMPSLIVAGSAPLGDPYLLPPIQYPDGRWYVKLGTGEFEHRLETLDELGDWFRHSGAAADRAALHQTLVALIPDLAGAPIHTDTCAVTATVSGYPYVDLLANGRVCVAVGGNGKAAKSADEIGRLAAELTLHGDWRDDLPAEAFRAHFRD
jgi:sarcosine oxidase